MQGFRRNSRLRRACGRRHFRQVARQRLLEAGHHEAPFARQHRIARTRGGLAQFGYPISEEMREVSPTDGQEYTVQYFERARFEYHPEYKGTPGEVLLGLLGVDAMKGKGWLQ